MCKLLFDKLNKPGASPLETKREKIRSSTMKMESFLEQCCSSANIRPSAQKDTKSRRREEHKRCNVSAADVSKKYSSSARGTIECLHPPSSVRFQPF
ncbi:hypothetical protein J6590_000141 [Homalodisca vitripennis]|nr:hypothetical protein J6590_000141 [Homalodisca vitripennis]